MQTIGQKMNAVRIHHSGGPEALIYERAPRPRIEPNQVLLRVRAAAISPNELSWLRDITRPTILSHEVSGIVAEVGAEVGHIKAGDAVYGLPAFTRDGAAAEYIAVYPDEVAPKPASIDHILAAAIPLSGLTAWQALRVHAPVIAGQRVLIHGGAGGVGSFAVQLARHFGAQTIATASRRNAPFVRELGADRVIDYSKEPFDSLVNDVDLVFDTVGGETLERSWNVLKRGGTVISVAEEPSAKRAAALGVRAIYFIVEPNHDHLVEVGTLVEEGMLRPIVSTVLPLAQARDAYELGLRGHMRGKIVLRVD